MKKFMLVLMLLLAFLSMPVFAAISTRSINRGSPKVLNELNRTFWAVNATTTDASGVELLKAAPTSATDTTQLYIDYIMINCVSAITVTIDVSTVDTAAASGTLTTLLGPFAFTTNGNNVVLRFLRPIEIAIVGALKLNSNTAGNITVYMEGFEK